MRRWLLAVLVASLLTGPLSISRASPVQEQLGTGAALAAPLSQGACPGLILWNQAGGCVGQTLWVTGTVVAGRYVYWATGRPTFLDLGLAYPDPRRFTVLIWGEDRYKFSPPPEQVYPGHNACVYGLESVYDSPQIVVRDPSQLKVCE
jgi:hypothetical protein